MGAGGHFYRSDDLTKGSIERRFLTSKRPPPLFRTSLAFARSLVWRWRTRTNLARPSLGPKERSLPWRARTRLVRLGRSDQSRSSFARTNLARSLAVAFARTLALISLVRPRFARTLARCARSSVGGLGPIERVPSEGAGPLGVTPSLAFVYPPPSDRSTP
jgi:hypothetical protein